MRKLLLSIFAAASCCLGAYAQQPVEKSVAQMYLSTRAEQPEFWMDVHANSYQSGDGTQESPYMISTPEQFGFLARQVHDGEVTTGVYYELANDIDLAGKVWFPIGLRSDGAGVIVAFDGYLDGKFHKIKNLKTMEVGDLMSMGLFGRVEEHAQIRNLIIASGDVIGGQCVGAIAGDNRGLIEDCINYATVGCSMFHCGGLVGSNSRSADLKQTSIIRHCINYGDIDAGMEYANGMSAGGITGTNISYVEECANFGNVRASNGGAGGLVGYFEGGVMKDCFVLANVHANLDQIGGLVACFFGRSASCEMQNCYFAGELSSDNPDETYVPKTGGVAGFAIFNRPDRTLKIKDCYYNKDLYKLDQVVGSWNDQFENKFTQENCKGLTTAEMQGDAFLSSLNAGGNRDAWMADSKNENKGYPMLNFMAEKHSGIADVEAASNLIVYVENGMIHVAEDVDAAESVAVYTYTGAQVFAGSVESLATTVMAEGLYLVKVGNKTCKVIVR